MKANRYNKGKLKWGLVHWPSLEPLVSVLMFGTEKYAPNNWKKGLDLDEILESAQRHLIALFNKEEYDTESKLSHAGHVMCNMMFYIYFKNNKKYPFSEGDDYWTIENNKIVWSCWDDVSEEIYDTNPNMKYYKTEEDAKQAKR